MTNFATLTNNTVVDDIGSLKAARCNELKVRCTFEIPMQAHTHTPQQHHTHTHTNNYLWRSITQYNALALYSSV